MHMLAAVLPTLTHAAAIVLGVLLALWIAGSVLLRLTGALSVAIGLAIALAHPAGLLITALGAVTWAAGHWLHALRHHAYESLARRLFLQILPARLDPTRRWAAPATTTTSDE